MKKCHSLCVKGLQLLCYDAKGTPAHLAHLFLYKQMFWKAIHHSKPPPPPPPPPPSPVSGFGKRKGLTTVRSGSSSPRRWGLLNSHRSEEQDVPFVVSEILESAWGNRGIRENTPVHPISGTLLHERFFAVTPMALETEHVSSLKLTFVRLLRWFLLVPKMSSTFSPMLHCQCKLHCSIKLPIHLCS